MKNILTKICIACGKEFTKPKSCGLPEWFGRKDRPLGRRFCSRKCSNKSKERTPSWNKGIPWTEDFRKKIVKIKKGKHYSAKTEFQKGQTAWNKGLDGKTYLSEEARKKMSVWKNKHGEGTPNWRGGTTKLGQLIRSCRMYYHWRNEVFDRDKRICKGCKANNVPIHADHIKPFYKILEENKITTIKQAKQCRELWETKNGRTLCIPCHKQTTSYLNVRRQK